MADSSISKGPNRVHPEEPSAIGSRNSLFREGRDEYGESKQLIDEEIERILKHAETKLTPEALEKLHVGGNVKDLLHNYFNQSFHNMYNRYLVTVEDELSKKFRDLIDQEEFKSLNHYTPTQVTDLLDSLGGAEQFNSAEVEQSIINVYGHLQGHLQKGVKDLQRKTAQMLQGKTDIGSIVRGDHSYALVKCQFSDNKLKPETVTDADLVINILEAELLSPMFHFQTATESIIKEAISDHIVAKLDEEIDELNKKLVGEGQGQMNESEQIFEKLKRLENHVDFDGANESPQYNYVAKEFFEKIRGIGSEMAKDESYDPLNIRENLQRIVDEANLRSAGFNAAVNALTGILDERQLGYQHIENFKNARKVLISEYADRSPKDLPDEKYSISMMYLDTEQLQAKRSAYVSQLEELGDQVQKLWEVFERIAKTERQKKRKQGTETLSFQEVAAVYTQGGSIPEPKAEGEKPQGLLAKLMGGAKKEETFVPPVMDIPEDEDKAWDEISFIQPEKSDREKLNDTFSEQRSYMKKKLSLLRVRLAESFGRNYPAERQIVEQRLDFLETHLEKFAKQFNPYNVRPGLFVELSFSTIKKQEATLKAMSDVLSSFLDSVAKGFTDASGAGWNKDRNKASLPGKVEFAAMPLEV